MTKTVHLLIEARDNIQYATGTPHHDPAVWVGDENAKGVLLTSALDFGSMTSHVNSRTEVINYSVLLKDNASEEERAGITGNVGIAIWYLKHIGATEVVVAKNGARSDDGMAGDYVDALRDAGFKVTYASPMFPCRERKDADEIKKIADAQAINERGFYRAFKILQDSTIAADNTLMWNGDVLTAEILRAEMSIEIYKAGYGTMESDGPIIACGLQGSDPHERGHGPLKAGELIVMDCFPRMPDGYWGDLTRTVIKGPIHPWQQDMFNMVLDAHNWVETQVKNGADSKAIFDGVIAMYEKAGYPTDATVPHGMFHGVGHSLGLGLHESPGIGSREGTLVTGNVVTNEPGLYYKGHNGITGGVRIEDILVVTDTGCDNITNLPKELDVDKISIPSDF